MSGGEPSSIKRSARATQSACTPCDRGKIFCSGDGIKNSEEVIVKSEEVRKTLPCLVPLTLYKRASAWKVLR